MTSVNLSRPLALYSDAPFLKSRNGSQAPSLTLKSFKKAYTGLSCMLNWGEKIGSSQIAPILSQQRKILKLHAATFDIPEWIDKTAKLSQDIAQARISSSSEERNKAIQKTMGTALDFTTASIQMAQCLNDTNLLDLAQYSPALPRALSAIGHVSKLVGKVSELYQSYMKARKRSGQVKGESIHAKVDKKHSWKVIDGARLALGCVNAILSAVAFYFSMSLPSYWMLGFSTFMFTSSLAIDLQPTLS